MKTNNVGRLSAVSAGRQRWPVCSGLN